MRVPINGFIVAAAAAVALTAAPAAAQHGGGGHSRGGHGGGSHSGGGHASSGATHQGAHASGGGHTTAHPAVGHAVPPTSAMRPHVDRHTTVVVPSHRSHVGSIAALGLGLGGGAYAYPYGYGYSGYAHTDPGYYRYSPGFYGGGYAQIGHARLRIVGAPRDAAIYVDGYYAGVVDDFDGRLQHLELRPGPHRIEIRAPGFAPIVLDVNAIDGRTITYRAQMGPYRP